MITRIKFVCLLPVFMPIAALGYALNLVVGTAALVSHTLDRGRRGYWFWYAYMASKFMGCHRTPDDFNPKARQWFEFSKHFQAFSRGISNGF